MLKNGIRASTARLMADGRWRTARDVADTIGCTVNQAVSALRRLTGLGLLECEYRADWQVRMWRKVP